MSLGLESAGFDVVAAVEFDPDIAAIHEMNFPGCETVVGDVRRVDFTRYRGVDHVHGSPPCQYFSMANASKVGKASRAPEADLALEWLRAIAEIKPRTISMEQVRGFYRVGDADTDIWNSIRGELYRMGYALEWGVRNAADFGIPQSRHRFFVRGIRAENLEEIPYERATRSIFGETRFHLNHPREPRRGWYAAVADLLPDCEESELTDWQKKRLPDWLLEGRFEEFQLFDARNLGRDGTLKNPGEPAFTILTDVVRSHRPRAIIPRALLVDVRNLGREATVKRESCSAFTVMARSAQDHQFKAFLVPRTGATASDKLLFRESCEPSPTVRALGHQGHWMRTNSVQATGDGGCPSVRLLSVRCLARLQSVPDEFMLPAKDALAGKVVGNGVPPLMAKKLLAAFAT